MGVFVLLFRSHLAHRLVSRFNASFSSDGTADESVDYKMHYYANHRAFFAIFSMFTIVDIADTLLKGNSALSHIRKTIRHQQYGLFHRAGDGRYHAKRTVSPVLCHFLSHPNNRDQLRPFPDAGVSRHLLNGCC